MSRNRIKVALALGALSALVYALTSPPGISWEHLGEDGPEFAAVGASLGISHPTGYPLYALILRVATMLGSVFGFEPARSAGMVSHLAAGAAVSVVAILFMTLLRRARARYYQVWGGVIGAALLAASPGWWGQANIIEVYPLHLLLTGLVLLAAASWRGSPRRLALVGFLVGLGFAHHMQMLLVLPAALLLVAAGGRPRRSALVGAVLCGVIPLTLYLVLFLRSRLDPLLDWGNPESLRQLAWVVSGAQYRFRMFHADLVEVWHRTLLILGTYLPAQFGWSALPLAPLGLIAFWRRGRRGMPALALLFLVQLAWAVNYSIPDPDAYYLPAMMAAAGMMAGGAGWLLERGLAGTTRRQRILGLAALGLALSQPLLQLPGNWQRVDLSKDHEAARFASESIYTLPEHALVLTDGDGRTFALWYEQIRRKRDDAVVVYRPLLQWRWCLDNLRGRHPDLVLPTTILPQAEMQRRLLADALGHRPVYTSYSDRALARNFVHHPVGALFQIDTLRSPVSFPTWPGMTEHALALDPIANADRRFDPFTPGSLDSRGLFRDLEGGSVRWGDVHFATPPGPAGWAPNCLSTSGTIDLRATLQLLPRPSRGVALLLSAQGLGTGRPNPGVTLEVAYRDGSVERTPIHGFREVWNHDAALEGQCRPEELETTSDTNAMLVALDPARTPDRLTFLLQPGERSEPIAAGILVLAATQLMDENSPR